MATLHLSVAGLVDTPIARVGGIPIAADVFFFGYAINSIAESLTDTTDPWNVGVTLPLLAQAAYGSANPLYAVRQHAQSSMRASIGELELDEILHARSVDVYFE